MRRPCTKEVLFAVLLKGHRLSPVMRAQYLSIAWLARTARTPDMLQVCVQAVWEASGGRPLPLGPVGKARRVMTRLGWIPIEGWWTWRLRGEDEPLRLVQDPES